MSNIHMILTDLAADSSRNAKISILNQHREYELLRLVCFLALDPFTQFYQRKIPAYTPCGLMMPLEEALNELGKLSSRSITGNAAIEFLSKMLGILSEDDAEIIKRIIQKDLKCGVSDATVNAVWPGLIPEYPCMLASAYDEKLVSKIQYPAFAQLKADGMRFNAIVKNGKCEFRTRNGKEINLASDQLAGAFIKAAGGQNLVFDGELLCVDPFGKFMDRKTGNGILNKAVKGTQSVAEGESVRAVVWDVVYYDSFVHGKDTTAYVLRLKHLTNLIGKDNHLIDIIETHEVKNEHEARVQFEKFLAGGQEGIILKDMSMIWENKRSKKQIKFKGELECDLKITGVVGGTGRLEGLLGALVCESQDGLVQTNVGSGFNDDQRKSFSSENIVGKIVAVKYNARITSKKAGDPDSLFLPIFVEIRDDKNVADSSETIK